MKKCYSIAIIYTTIMASGMLACRKFWGVSYLDTDFINTFIPFLAILTLFSTICYQQQKRKKADNMPQYSVFMLLFIPVVLIAVFAILQKFEISKAFLIPLVGALLVGLNEELIYRGVIFANAVEEKGLIKAVFFSAVAFSLLHSVNIFGGLSPASVISQLIATFIAGVFLALSYRNVKKIWLLVCYHALWDYISLSGIGKTYPIIDLFVVMLMLIELIVSFFMLRSIGLQKCVK